MLAEQTELAVWGAGGEKSTRRCKRRSQQPRVTKPAHGQDPRLSYLVNDLLRAAPLDLPPQEQSRRGLHPELGKGNF